MQPETIQEMIESNLPGSRAEVFGDGRHFQAVVICDEFDGKTMLQQHRMVYAALGDHMESAIHALSIRTYTIKQWEDAQSAGNVAESFA